MARRTTRTVGALCAASIAAGTLAVGVGAGSAPDDGLPQGRERVRLDARDFVSRIDNRYFPMQRGTMWTYRETEPGGPQKQVVVTVTHQRKRILGIEATVVHDVVTEAGQVREDTWDWYAQDREGNVWYLGEDTKAYEEGGAVSTEGSWRAGVDGAQAGIVMPAEPRVGQTYRQEYYPGHAEDAASVLGVREWAQTPLGIFRGALLTKDYTSLDADILEYKLYAKGVGPVLILDVSGDAGREELVQFQRRQ
jgi:hypothetical protein